MNPQLVLWFMLGCTLAIILVQLIVLFEVDALGRRFRAILEQLSEHE